MAGIGRRLGAHGGEMESQKRLDVAIAKLAGVDGEGHEAGD